MIYRGIMGYLGDYMVRVTIWKLNMNYLPNGQQYSNIGGNRKKSGKCVWTLCNIRNFSQGLWQEIH